MKDQRKVVAWLLVIAILFGGAVAAQAGTASPAGVVTYRVVKTYSNVSFTIFKWVVMKEEGLFREFSGQIQYDPSAPSRSKVSFAVQVDSIDTRNTTREAVLRSEDFFDAQKYPTMTFRSASVQAMPDHTLQVNGDLTIHGVSKRITIPVKYLGANVVPNVGQLAGFETSFTIDRTDYGVNGWKWSGGKIALSKEVTIHLTIGGQKAD
jgi:polyisoprenoid-binding protein YceI